MVGYGRLIEVICAIRALYGGEHHASQTTKKLLM